MPAWYSSATNPEIRVPLAAIVVTMVLALLPAASSATAQQGSFSTGQGSSLLSEEPRFLPVGEAFPFYITLDSEQQVSIHWDIADGYYLYQEQFAFELTGHNGEALMVQLPEGTPHNDAYFGDVTVYRNQLRATLTLPDDIAPGSTQQLRVRFQGCAAAGLCYPPQQQNLEISPRQSAE